MSAARIVTTTEKFDETGKLVERITGEKFTEECGCRCAGRKTQTENIGIWKEPLINGSASAREMYEEMLKEAEKARLYTGKIPFFW